MKFRTDRIKQQTYWRMTKETKEDMKLKIKKLHPDSIVPKYATPGAACFDLHAVIVPCEDHDADDFDENGRLVITPASAATIRTGVSFEVPEGHVLMIYSRSGHGFKNGVRLGNAVGVLDSDFRGEAMVRLQNDSYHIFHVSHGDRIAQAMVIPVQQVQFEEVDELSTTERGEGGLGSTGVR